MNDWTIATETSGVKQRIPGQPIIRVIGVGGGGTNAVHHMMTQGIEGVDFICANTDTQHLDNAEGAIRIALGGNMTNGLGAGANPQIGFDAAMHDRDRIRAELEGSDMVFIAAGMGGGTGTGAAPVVAEIANELNALTVAVTTKPFDFEGQKRMNVAEEGLENLVDSVHSLIVIPNQRLIEHFGKAFKMKEAFGKANEVLHGAVRGISDVATKTGYINVDFEDVRTVMSMRGTAMMGSGSASGDSRAEEAVKEALACPLLEEMDVRNAAGVLVNMSASDAELGELQLVMEQVQERAAPGAQVVTGCQTDDSCGEDLRVTVIMTGLTRPMNSPQTDRPSERTAPPAAANYDSLLDIPTLLSKQTAE